MVYVQPMVNLFWNIFSRQKKRLASLLDLKDFQYYDIRYYDIRYYDTVLILKEIFDTALKNALS